MTTSHLAIWSGMIGGLLTISLASLSDAFLSKSRGALVGFGFIAALTLYASLLSGLAESLVPGLSPQLLCTLKIAMGPVCCMFALYATSRWLDVRSNDEFTCPLMRWSTAALLATTMGLVFASIDADELLHGRLLLVSALCCFGSIGLTGFCAWRAYLQGDKLAIWVSPTALVLSVTIYGLYVQAWSPGSLPTPMIALTALCAVSYVLMIAALTLVRTRQQKRLERLAGLHIGTDPITGLPTGSALVAKVDDAFWRSARNGKACNVVCLHLHNLYELADQAGQGVENQILLAMSARVRRAVGFRCTMGLYHARCFLLVIQVPQESQKEQIDNFTRRLRYLITKPLAIQGHRNDVHAFHPEWGIGVVSAPAEGNDSGEILRQAERLAMHDGWIDREAQVPHLAS